MEHGIPPNIWSGCLKSLEKAMIPPKVKWTSISIMYRTNWTNSKQAKRTKNAADAICSNCYGKIEDTFHLYYECPIAKKVYKHFMEIFEKCTGIAVVDTFQLMVFS